MNPGLICNPVASMTFLACSADKLPTAAISSDLIPISPMKDGEPVPSRTFPFLMIKSKEGVASILIAEETATAAVTAAASLINFLRVIFCFIHKFYRKKSSWSADFKCASSFQSGL
jgi:hypothetical protein